MTKQREVLHSDTHLVEIDLLRRGPHVVAIDYAYNFLEQSLKAGLDALAKRVRQLEQQSDGPDDRTPG